MEATSGRQNCKGKAVAVSSSSAAATATAAGGNGGEFKCPRCNKAFSSAHGLCAHQSIHRLVKEPTKISPVLAAVLNNPLPPNTKPPLILPSRPKPPAAAACSSQANQAGCCSQPINLCPSSPEESSVDDSSQIYEGGDDNYEEEEHEVEVVPYVLALPAVARPPPPPPPPAPAPAPPAPAPRRVTVDLLGEWVPMNWSIRPRAAVLARVGMNQAEAAAAGRELSLRSRPEVDLELRLGR